MRRPGRRLFTFLFSLVYLTGQVVLAHAAETNMWSERRRVVAQNAPRPTLAQLPANVSPATSVFRQIPLRTGQLSRPDDAIPTAIGAISPSLRTLMTALPIANIRLVDTWAPDKTGTEDPVVILQDIHLNGEAQSNLAAALNALIEKGRVSFVGVEGAFGPFNFSPFRAFPLTANLRAVLKRLLEAGKIAAPSVAGITAPALTTSFFGVDDEKSYAKNVRAYLTAMETKSTVEKSLSRAEEAWKRERTKSLSPGLARLSALRARFQEGSLPILDYARFLNEQGAAPGETISRYLEACRLEAALDWDRVERERNEALTRLAARLSSTDVEGLIGEAVAFREGRIGLADFYRRLTARFRASGVSLQSLPAFQSYLEYALLADTVKPESVLGGLNAWESATIERLAPSDAERELLRVDAHLSLITKLTAFSLTPEEWDHYRLGKAGLNGMKTSAGQKRAASLQPLLDQLQPFEDFYAEADKRTAYMADQLSKAPAGARAIVIGGFHTPALHARLMAAGIPHVIVMPRVTKVDAGSATAYLSIFQREKESVSRLFSGRQLFLSPAMIAGIGTGRPVAAPFADNVLGQEAAASRAADAAKAGFTVTRLPGGHADVDNSNLHLDVDTVQLESRPRTSRAASFLDAYVRRIFGLGSNAYKRFTGWVAPVLETPVFGLVYAAAFITLQAAGVTAVFPGSEVLLAALALAVGHAVTNRDWRLSSMAWWTAGGIVLVLPFSFLPVLPALLASAALHVIWNHSYLRGWFAVPMSLFGYAAPDLGGLVTTALETRSSTVFTDAANPLAAALYAEAVRSGKSFLHVRPRDQSDLQRLRTTFISHPDGTYETKPGPLFDILKSGGILFIDYSESDPKLVEGFNSLFDKEPYYDEETTISPDLKIVGAVRDRDVKKYPVSFYSRFRQKLELTQGFPDPVDEIPWTEGEAGISPLELFESPVVREPLLGLPRLDKRGGVVLDPGALEDAMKSEPPTLIIRGADWSNPVLRDLVRDMIVKGKVEINGAMRNLPPKFRILRQRGDYGKRKVKDKTLLPSGATDSKLPVYLINLETQDQLLTIMEAAEGNTLQQRPGLLAQPEVRLRITEDVPNWVWHRILHSEGTKVILEIDPKVPVPAEYREILTADLTKSNKFERKPTPLKELKDRPAIMIEANDMDFALDQIRSEFGEPKIVPLSVSPGTRYEDLVSRMDVTTGPDGRWSFTPIEGSLLKDLRDGKVVVLEETDANPALIRRLQTALTDDGYLSTYGDGEPRPEVTGEIPGWVRLSSLPGKLVIVSRSSRGTAASLPFARLVPSNDDLAEAISRHLEAKSSSFKFERGDFDKVMALRDIFQAAVKNKILKAAPNMSLSRLLMIYAYKGDWMRAFEEVIMNDYADDPEVVAFMRTMVRVTFDVDEPGQNARPRNSIAKNKIEAALNALHERAPLSKIAWRLVDALSLDVLKNPRYGLNIQTDGTIPPGIYDLIAQSLITANRTKEPDRAAAFEDQFNYKDNPALPAPTFDEGTPIGQYSTEKNKRSIRNALDLFNIVFLRGPPGSGKSYLAAEVARDLGSLEEPVTVGPDVTEEELIVTKNGKPGRLTPWIENGGVLIIDEANLMNPDFWNFISRYVSPTHKVIFTGNQETLPGRKIQKYLRDHAITIPFEEFSDKDLRGEIAKIVGASAKQNHPRLTNLLFDLFSTVRAIGKDSSFSIRDVQELAARADIMGANNWEPAEMVGLAWRMFNGSLTPVQREAFRQLIPVRYGVTVKELEDKSRKDILDRYAADFARANLVPTKTVLETIGVIEEFLIMREARMEGRTSVGGKRGLIIEGPSGRGKDEIVDLVLRHFKIQLTGTGAERYDRTTASLQYEGLMEKIDQSQTDGAINVVSELNLLPSNILEGKLNDALTRKPGDGKVKPGFAFIATINSSEFGGRETLSSALLNRVIYRKEKDYPQDELLEIAKGEAARLEANLANVAETLTLIVNAHVWIRDEISDTRFSPTTRDLRDAIGRAIERKTPAANALDIVLEVYGPLFMKRIMKKSLPSSDFLKKYTEAPPFDNWAMLRTIGASLINRPDIPFDVGPDASRDRDPDEGGNIPVMEGDAGGYNEPARNYVGMRTSGLKEDLQNWLNTFLHEVSHGMFTRRTRLTPGFGDQFTPLYQCLEDVRHQAAFLRFFPPTRLNPESSIEEAIKLVLFDRDKLLELIKEKRLSPRGFFQYLIVSTAKGLITDDMLRKANAIMGDEIPGRPIEVALKHAATARAIAEAIPDQDKLNEMEIRFRQHQGLALMLKMKEDYRALSAKLEKRVPRPSQGSQQKKKDAAIETVRKAPITFQVAPQIKPVEVRVPTDEEVAALVEKNKKAPSPTVNLLGDERRDLLDELALMEKDLRNPRLTLERAEEIIQQLTHAEARTDSAPGAPVDVLKSVKEPLERSDAGTQARGQKILKLAQDRKEGRPPPRSLFEKMTSRFSAYLQRLLGTVVISMPSVRVNQNRVVAAAITAVLAVMLIIMLANLNLTEILMDIREFVLANMWIALLPAVAAGVALAVLALFPVSQTFKGSFGAIATDWGAPVKSRYGDAVIHDMTEPDDYQGSSVPPLRKAPPPAWTQTEISNAFQQINERRAEELEDTMRIFVAERLQPGRIYGPSGTPDLNRLITDMVNFYYRYGGIPDKVKKQVVVVRTGDEPLLGISEAALAFLAQQGFPVRVINEAEATDELISEIEREGPVEKITAAQLRALVEPLYFHGAFAEILDGRTLTSRPAPVPTAAPGQDIRGIVVNILKDLGVEKALERGARMRVSGTGPSSRVELSLTGTNISSVAQLSTLKPYLTILDLRNTTLTNISSLSAFPHLRVLNLPQNVNPEEVENLLLNHRSGPEMDVYVGGQRFNIASIRKIVINDRLARGNINERAQAAYLASKLEEASRPDFGIEGSNSLVILENGFVSLDRAKNSPSIADVSKYKWIRSLSLGKDTMRSTLALLDFPNLTKLSVIGELTDEDITTLLRTHPNGASLQIVKSDERMPGAGGSEPVIYMRNWRDQGKLRAVTLKMQFQEAQAAFPGLAPNAPNVDPIIAGLTEDSPKVRSLDQELLIVSDSAGLLKFGFWPSLTDLTVTDEARTLSTLHPFPNLKRLTLHHGASDLRDLLLLPNLNEVHLADAADAKTLCDIVARHPNPRFTIFDPRIGGITKNGLPEVYKPSGTANLDRPLNIDEQANEVERLSRLITGLGYSKVNRKNGGLEVEINVKDLDGMQRLTDMVSLKVDFPLKSVAPLAGLPKLKKIELRELPENEDLHELVHLEDISLEEAPMMNVLYGIFENHPNGKNLTIRIPGMDPLTYASVKRELSPASRIPQIETELSVDDQMDLFNELKERRSADLHNRTDAIFVQAGVTGARVTFPDLTGMENLHVLQFIEIDAENPNILPLAKLPNLKDITLHKRTDITQLAKISQLQSIHFEYMPELSQLAVILTSHPNTKLAIYIPGRVEAVTLENIDALAVRSAKDQVRQLRELLGNRGTATLQEDDTIHVVLKTNETKLLGRSYGISQIEFKGVNSADMKPLRRLPNLRKIILRESALSILEFEELSGLTHIEIDNKVDRTLPSDEEFVEFFAARPNATITIAASGAEFTSKSLPVRIRNMEPRDGVSDLDAQEEAAQKLLDRRGGGTVIKVVERLNVAMRSSDLHGFENLDAIQEISITGGRSVVDWKPVQELHRLADIHLVDTPFKLEDLNTLANLDRLELGGTSVQDRNAVLRFIRDHPNKGNIRVINGGEGLTFANITPEIFNESPGAAHGTDTVEGQAQKLRDMALDRSVGKPGSPWVEVDGDEIKADINFSDLSGFEEITELTELTINTDIEDLSPLYGLRKLRMLIIKGNIKWEQLLNLPGLEVVIMDPFNGGFYTLQTIAAHHRNAPRFRIHLDTLGGNHADAIFRIDTTPSERNHVTTPPLTTTEDVIGQRNTLREVSLERSKARPRGLVHPLFGAKIDYSDLGGFESLTQLQYLDINNTPDIDLTPLVNLPKFENLALSNPIMLHQLIRLTRLNRIDLGFEPPAEDLLFLLERHPNRQIAVSFPKGRERKVYGRNEIRALKEYVSAQEANRRARISADAVARGQASKVSALAIINGIAAKNWIDSEPANKASATVTPLGLIVMIAKVKSLERFGDIGFLESLDLRGSTVRDLSPLASLRYLKKIDIRGLSDINPDDLLKIESLTEVIVDEKQFSDAPFIEHLGRHNNKDFGVVTVKENEAQPHKLAVVDGILVESSMADRDFLRQLFGNLVNATSTLDEVRKRFSEEGRREAFEALLRQVVVEGMAEVPGFAAAMSYGNFSAPLVTGDSNESLDLGETVNQSRKPAVSRRVDTSENPAGRAAAAFAIRQKGPSGLAGRLAYLLGGRERADFRLREFSNSPSAQAFASAVKRVSFDDEGIVDTAAAVASGMSARKRPALGEAFNALFEVVSQKEAPEDLGTALATAIANKRPLVFIKTGPEDESRIREARRLAKLQGDTRIPIEVSASDVMGTDGRISLSKLDAYLQRSLPNGLAGAFLLLPQGVPFTPDISDELLRSLLIATLDELMQVRALEGQTVENILKVARVIATNA